MPKSITCASCQKVIHGPRPYCKVAGKGYHTSCFICQNCNTDLTTGYYEYKNYLLCEPCYQEKAFSKCAACNRLIGSGSQMVNTMDMHFHVECLICKDCKKIVKGCKVYPVNGVIYCVNCHYARKLEAETKVNEEKESEKEDN